MAAHPNPATTHVGRLVDEGIARGCYESRAELARAINASASYVTKIAMGRTTPSESFVRRLAIALDQEPEEYYVALLADENRLPPPTYYLKARTGLPLRDEDVEEVMRLARHLGRTQLGPEGDGQ